MLNGFNCSRNWRIMMLKNYYEHEKINKNIYDGVREYCKNEHVNEEYFRSCASKSGLPDKPKKELS